MLTTASVRNVHKRFKACDIAFRSAVAFQLRLTSLKMRFANSVPVLSKFARSDIWLRVFRHTVRTDLFDPGNYNER